MSKKKAKIEAAPDVEKNEPEDGVAEALTQNQEAAAEDALLEAEARGDEPKAEPTGDEDAPISGDNQKVRVIAKADISDAEAVSTLAKLAELMKAIEQHRVSALRRGKPQRHDASLYAALERVSRR